MSWRESIMRGRGGLLRAQELLDEIERLVRVAWAHDVKVRHGAKRHEVLDWFVGRAVFADAYRVVGVDEDARPPSLRDARRTRAAA